MERTGEAFEFMIAPQLSLKAVIKLQRSKEGRNNLSWGGCVREKVVALKALEKFKGLTCKQMTPAGEGWSGIWQTDQLFKEPVRFGLQTLAPLNFGDPGK